MLFAPIRNNPRMAVVEELPPTDEDRAAGVAWQAKVTLGDQWQGEPIRVVRVEVDGKSLLLATDLEIEAELIRMYLMGYADLNEMIALPGVEKTAKSETGMFQTGMNSNSRGWGMRSYPGRGFPQPEHLGLALVPNIARARTRNHPGRDRRQ
jgi:hypothetical protein